MSDVVDTEEKKEENIVKEEKGGRGEDEDEDEDEEEEEDEEEDEKE